ncbi:MAG: hypothetical protein R3E53_20335 [Myxococcota bacterium]
MDRGHGLLHVILVLACIAFVAALCWLVLHYAGALGHRIGLVGVNVLVRVRPPARRDRRRVHRQRAQADALRARDGR